VSIILFNSAGAGRKKEGKRNEMRDGTGKKEQTNKSEKGRDIGSMGGE
jgi:hypothetical protein